MVIEACISILFHEGLEEEGLFRIAGSTSKLKKLKVCVHRFREFIRLVIIDILSMSF